MTFLVIHLALHVWSYQGDELMKRFVVHGPRIGEILTAQLEWRMQHEHRFSALDGLPDGEAAVAAARLRDECVDAVTRALPRK